MESRGASRLSTRSLRIRWNDDDPKIDHDPPELGSRLLKLVYGVRDRDYEIITSLASYSGEYCMTVTFPDDTTAQIVYEHIANLRELTVHFDHSFNGLTILQSPEDFDIDICCVHGLHGNAADTFTGKSKLWPRDLLPRTIPFDKARIMTFGYNAKFREKEVTARMGDWADMLLRAVGGVRIAQNYSEKPIIFIAYSMGGLVARKAIERLHQFVDVPEEYPGIHLSNCGILFISTPHLGTVEADFGKKFSHALGVLTGLREDAILNELKSFNATAGESIDRWRAMSRSGIIPPFECLCESRKTKVFSGMHREMVTNVAASFLDQRATQLPDADHFQVCKYDNIFDPGYKDVIGKLVILRWKLLNRGSPFVQRSSNVGYWVSNAPTNADRHVLTYHDGFQFPGKPHPTAYRYPLPKNRKFYSGALLKPRTGHFQGRQATLHDLMTAVAADSSSDENSIIALSGVGGIGKTEILLEYGLITREEKHVFFCQAKPGQTFQSCIYKLAAAIGSEALYPNVDLADRETIWNGYTKKQRVDAFTRWLQTGSIGASVILLDDADALQEMVDFEDLSATLRALPYTVLLTTRDPNMGKALADASQRDSQEYTVKDMSSSELERVMRHFLDSGVGVSQADIHAIAQLVDGHTMAACRAVQYICQVVATTFGQDSVRRFLTSFDGRSNDYEMREGFLNFQPRVGKSLAACFEASIQRLGPTGDLANRILNFAAHLTVPGIDFYFFFQHPRPWLSAIPQEEQSLSDELFNMSHGKLAQSISKLTTTSALTRTDEGKFVVHTLMLEYLLHRQQHGGRIVILKQILLLSQISIRLNEQRHIFEQFAANCLSIAQRFRIDLKDINPSPQLLDKVTGIGLAQRVRTLTSRLQDLAQRRQLDNQIFLLDHKREQYLQEVLQLTIDFEQIWASFPPNRNTEVINGVKSRLRADMAGAVRNVNPVYHANLLDENWFPRIVTQMGWPMPVSTLRGT